MKDMAKNLFLFFHLFVWLLYFFPHKILLYLTPLTR